MSLEIMLQDLRRDLKEDISEVKDDVKSIMKEGCIQGKEDRQRLKTLEEVFQSQSKLLIKLVWTGTGSLITLLILTVAFLLKYVLFR